ncbi:MAG: DUF2442 domain-containing protein [SAR202 cluster bacterium]|nr:DUF2442 domain-containing protein [SAR202 cluster bacterium]
MTSSGAKAAEVLAVDVWFDAHMLYMRLNDGREVGVPLEWFPPLRRATDMQRGNWRLIGNGVGIHWEDIDEDISVAGLLMANRAGVR